MLALAIAVVGGPVPAHAASDTEITGTLVAPAGAPSNWLDRVVVNVVPATLGGASVPAQIAPDGTFTVTGLSATARYRIQFEDRSKHAAPGWLRTDGKLATHQSNSNSFPAGTQGLTIAPSVAGSIGGHLELPSELPDWLHEDAQIDIYRTTFDGGQREKWVQPDDDGTFLSTDLPVGESFYVRISHNHIRGAWMTADGTFSTDRDDRAPVTVGTSGLELTVDASLLQPAIRGTAHMPAGMAGADATLYFDGPIVGIHRDAKVQPDGQFYFGAAVEGASYKIRLYNGGALLNGHYRADGTWPQDAEDGTDVPTGSVIDLYPVRGASISGKVSLADGVTRSSSAFVRLSSPTHLNQEINLRSDGSYEFVGLRPGTSFHVSIHNRAAWAPASTADGYVGDDGLLHPIADDARLVTAPASGIDATITPLTSLQGRVELPEGFTFDAENPPTVTAEHQFESMGGVHWGGMSPAAVSSAGTFTVDGTHPRGRHRLQLTWPDERKVYWTSDRTAPAADAAQAGTTLPRRDVFFPVRDVPEPAPEPQPEPQPEPIDKVAPKVSATLVKKGTTRSKVRLKVKVRSAVTKSPVGKIEVRYAKKTRTFSLKASHRGNRTVTIPRGKARGTIVVRYRPTGSSTTTLKTAQTKIKVTKVAPKVTVKTKKKISRTARAKLTIRVKTPLAKKPTGKVKVNYGKKSRTVTLKARHKGKVTVRLPRLAKGKHKIRVRYIPAKSYKPYLKAKKSKTVTLRVR